MIKKVLITGGLGYVGGRVAQELVKHHDLHVTVSTRRPLSTPPRWLQDSDTVVVDLLSEASLENVCRGHRFIVHLAAPNEIDSAADPQNALLVNVLGTFKLLEAAQRVGVERFIYFSTAHVYGAPLVGSITEQTLPRPVHPYAITHKGAEDCVLAARYQGKIQAIVLRLSNSFGAPAHAAVNRWILVVNDLCRQVVANGKIILRTPGLQWRDFITLTDVTRAVEHVLSMPEAAGADGLFNLGGNFPLRIIDMARLVAQRAKAVLGVLPEIQRPAPGPDDNHQHLDFKVDKLKATGFVLRKNHEEEIDATLRFCRGLWEGKENPLGTTR